MQLKTFAHAMLNKIFSEDVAITLCGFQASPRSWLKGTLEMFVLFIISAHLQVLLFEVLCMCSMLDILTYQSCAPSFQFPLLPSPKQYSPTQGLSDQHFVL